ncbi:BTAD domain-containing putative transcriptional regulator [Nocardioides sp. SYSU D00038]|uniref:AfsR/SARP family transcriptional regulator n=1 Tax=Nocardioides sp. SYSU D00038 TaxID=2812554 RepID=UPI001966E1C3|nr:BTAD domain-containing putative transcriptional regulator [Nocardioides sp. SYSU D00038]
MEGSPAPTLSVGVLGGFEVRFGDEPLDVRGAGQRVLALLAVRHRHRAAARLDLAEQLWPDAATERAAANLRSVLWRLPRPRGRVLVRCTSRTVRLHDDVRVDLWDAQDRAESVHGSAPPSDAELDDLLDHDLHRLLQHDLLPLWSDEWLVVERESHRQERLHALEVCSRTLCRQGRYGEALLVGLAALRSEPLRESAHRTVIEVHLAEDNHAEALRQYDAYRHLIGTELGLPPSPTIRDLVAPLVGTARRRRPRRAG